MVMEPQLPISLGDLAQVAYLLWASVPLSVNGIMNGTISYRVSTQ